MLSTCTLQAGDSSGVRSSVLQDLHEGQAGAAGAPEQPCKGASQDPGQHAHQKPKAPRHCQAPVGYGVCRQALIVPREGYGRDRGLLAGPER